MEKKTEKMDVKGLAFNQGMVHVLYTIGFVHPCSLSLGNLILKRMGQSKIVLSGKDDTPNEQRTKLSEIPPVVVGYDGSDPASELKGLDEGLLCIHRMGHDPGKATAIRTSLEKRIKKGA